MASERKRFNLEELVAYEHAYGGKLDRKRQLQLIAFPVVMLGAYSYVLTQEVLVALVVALVGVVVGYFLLLPRQVRENYYEASYIQRNLLINQLSQSMLDESRTFDRALIIARDNIEGSIHEEDDDYNELKHDLNVLIGQLILRPGKQEIKRAFRDFESAYAFDDLFVLFFEQIETKVLEGYVNEAVLSELMKQHNELYHQQVAYNNKLNMRQKEFQIITVVMAIILWFTSTQIVSAMGNEIKTAYFQSPLGISIAVIFAVAYTLLLIFFYQHYFDRNLMALSSSRDRLVKLYEVKPYDDKQAEDVNRFRAKLTSRIALKTLSEKERKMMQKLNLSIVDEINFQRNRLIKTVFAFAFGLIVASLSHAVWVWIIPFALAGLAYFMDYRKLETALASWTLNREMAFAKFMRLLTPYLLSGVNNNDYRLFDQIGSRLNAENDRRMVYQLLESIRLNPGKEEPYTEFANTFSGSPRAVTYMSSIYGVLHTTGSSAVIETLAKQADQEFMEQVTNIANKKAGKLGVISTMTFIVGMIPLLGMLSGLLFITIKPLFSGGLGL